MRELVLDGRNWQTRDDVYDAFFAAVVAPSWHGRNFNALRDSIATGDINQIKVPYRVVIGNSHLISGEAVQMVADFANFLHELSASGCSVAIELRDSQGTV
jgi:RNAse (barnase) inhibitor barstar